MKNKYFFIGMLFTCLIFCENSYSQTPQNIQDSHKGKANYGSPVITNIQRYKIDYEIENFQFTNSNDSLFVNSLELSHFEESRQMSEDVIIPIDINGTTYNLIFYSVHKAGIKKRVNLNNNENH